MPFFLWAQQNTYEDILYRHIVRSYSDAGIHLTDRLDTFEAYLVNCGVLSSTGGIAYYEYFEKIARNDEWPDSVGMDDFNDFYLIPPQQLYRMDGFEPNSIPSPRLQELSKKFSGIVRKGDFSPHLVAEAIISVLGPADFESPYYRTTALLSIAYLNCPYESSYSKGKETYESKNRISVTLDETNKLAVNGISVSETELTALLYAFIQSHPSDHIITFKVHRNTSYRVYTAIQDTIMSVYDSIREEEARKKFGKPFSELSPEEQEEIIGLCPTRVAE